MRLAFFILTLILIAVLVWTVWVEENPEWRHYQEVLRDRSEQRLLSMIEDAREVLGRYEVQARLRSIDAELAVLDADTSAAARRAREISARLPEIRRQTRRLRSRLREEEGRFASPSVSRRHRAMLSLLAQAKESYATASGTWPADEDRLEGLKSRCDSLSRQVASFLLPVDSLLAEVDSLRHLENELRAEADSLGIRQDSLLTEKQRIFSPVAALEGALARLRAQPSGIREIVSADGGEVARCPTCHGDLTDFPAAHPPLASTDAFIEVPCTVCHRGVGRALDVKRAHRGLLSGAGYGAGPFSLRARIDGLRSADPAARREAMEELRHITGIDPPMKGGEITDSDSAEVVAWLEWWEFARRYFETTYDDEQETSDQPLAFDLDPWAYTSVGRPLRYVGSQECLGCHQTLHREHCERWMATKFKSLERLKDEKNPEPCYRCHATGYDPATGTYVEPGVTCEGCHGPGERYSEMMFVGMELSGRGETGRGKALLDQSSRISREAISFRMLEGDYGPTSVCVWCHHPRRHKEGGPSALERTVEETIEETETRVERDESR